MTFWFPSDAMRVAIELAAGAPSDPPDTDAVMLERDSDSTWYVRSRRTTRGTGTDGIRAGVNSRRDRRQLGLTELVTARPDRRPEHGVDDRLGERTDRMVDHSGCQPAPTSVQHRQLTLGPDEHDWGAVGDPDGNDGVVLVGEDDVAHRKRRLVGVALRTCSHDIDAVPLIGHGPRQINETMPTTRQDLWGDSLRMEVAIRPARAADRDPRCLT